MDCVQNSANWSAETARRATGRLTADRPTDWPGGQEIDHFETRAPGSSGSIWPPAFPRWRRCRPGAGARRRPPTRSRRSKHWCRACESSRGRSTATPAATRSPSSFTQLTQARLVRINRQTQELEPWLAESWTASPDGLTYTLKLRSGVTFSDGAPFTSADVLFAFRAIYDEKMPPILGESIRVGGKPLAVTAPDAGTVVVRFPSAFGPGIRLLDNLRDPAAPQAGSGAERRHARQGVGSVDAAIGDRRPRAVRA